MSTSFRTTALTTSPNRAIQHLQSLMTAAEAAALLRTKPWPIVKAIQAGELRASMPSNEGPWLIRPEDLSAYVDRFANKVTGGALSQDEHDRKVAERAEDRADREQAQA